MTENERAQSAVYVQIADRAGGLPHGITRADVAREFNIHKTTAKFHLENCVKKGLLIKTFTWIDQTHRGWVYQQTEHAIGLLA